MSAFSQFSLSDKELILPLLSLPPFLHSPLFPSPSAAVLSSSDAAGDRRRARRRHRNRGRRGGRRAFPSTRARSAQSFLLAAAGAAAAPAV